jgi:integrase
VNDDGQSGKKLLNRIGDNSVYRTIQAYLGHKDIRHTEQYRLGGNRDSVHSSKHL